MLTRSLDSSGRRGSKAPIQRLVDAVGLRPAVIAFAIWTSWCGRWSAHRRRSSCPLVAAVSC